MSFLLPVKKLRFTEIELLAQGHTASECWSLPTVRAQSSTLHLSTVTLERVRLLWACRDGERCGVGRECRSSLKSICKVSLFTITCLQATLSLRKKHGQPTSCSLWAPEQDRCWPRNASLVFRDSGWMNQAGSSQSKAWGSLECCLQHWKPQALGHWFSGVNKPAMPDSLQELKIGIFKKCFTLTKGLPFVVAEWGFNKCMKKLEKFRYWDEHFRY